MAAILPRRQAARLGELFGKRFLPGLVAIEGAPRRGKTDLLLQLHGALLGRREVATAILRLGYQPLPAGAAAEVAAQLLARLEWRRLPPGPNDSAPKPVLSRASMARLAEREDFAAWKELLDAAAGAPDGFFAALGRLAAEIGPVCLLIDDATDEVLAPAARSSALDLAVVATASGPAASRWARQVVAVEEFTAREGTLLAEGLARHLGVEFCGDAAKPFSAYCAADPFVLSSVVHAAALAGTPLNSTLAFVRAYVAGLRRGTLGAYFSAVLGARLGSPERRCALEWLAGERCPTAAEKWRGRILLDDLLANLAGAGLAVAGPSGWMPRRWPAARDWAALQLARPETIESEAAKLATAVLAAAHAAGGELAREPLRRRIAGGLAEAVPVATFPSRLRFREVCEVASEPLPGGELFLCYGLTGAPPAAGSAALLAVAVADPEARLGSVLEEMENRVRQALPFSESRATRAETAGVEKWVVMRQPEPGDAEWAASHDAQLLDFERFNQLIAARSDGCVAARWETVLRLPPEADFELAAVRALDLLAERAGCDAQAALQARAALVEACLNAFEHGRTDGSQSSSASVEVRLAAWPGCIEMAVSNPGAPFAPGGAGPGQSSLHRGHGLKIIQAVMDQVIVSSDLNGTTIRMTKKFPYGGEGRTAGLPEHEQAASGI